MKTIVTGHLGFIGSALKKKLEENGHEVLGLDIADSNYFSNLQEAYSQRYDVVYHLGAVSGIKACDINPAAAWRLNVETTKVYVKQISCNSFNFVSSHAVTDMLANTTLPTIYSMAKFAGEKILDFSSERKAPKGRKIRLRNVYGPGSLKKNSVIARMCKDALKHESIFLNTEPWLKRSFVYIDEVINKLMDFENETQMYIERDIPLSFIAQYISNITGATMRDMYRKEILQRKGDNILPDTNPDFCTKINKTLAYFQSFSLEELN